MKKQAFNLIEIALAAAVIAIGMSSILVLFPVGINASNSAAADNMIPDVADYVLSNVECEVQAAWRNADGRALSVNNFLNSQVPTSKPNSSGTFGNSDFAGKEPFFYTGTKGQFCYHQSYTVDGTTVTDFAAEVLIWQEDEPVVLLQKSSPGKAEKVLSGMVKPGSINMDSGPVSIGAPAVAVCAEISYPAELPYDRREKYYFRREMFNQAEEL